MEQQRADASPRRAAVLTSGTGEAAAACIEVLRVAGWQTSEMVPGPEIVDVLRRAAPDVVLKADLQQGDGRLEGLLELLQIPYSHSGVLSTALAADRHQAKVMFRAAGLPVTDHVVVGRAEAAKAHQMSPPYVVKAIRSGSSMRTIVVGSEHDAPPERLLDADLARIEEVMVERYVPGRTLDVAVMGDVALAVSDLAVETTPHLRRQAQADKRIQLVTPAQISPNIYEKLQKMSLNAHAVLGCRGVTRTRFRYNEQAGGETGIVLLDVDTQPELAPASLVAEQARFAGHSFAELVAWLVEDASCNR